MGRDDSSGHAHESDGGVDDDDDDDDKQLEEEEDRLCVASGPVMLTLFRSVSALS